ncbi:hypothetical protein ON010_g16827 [Phytophthora cinnamomi]|nr:hypothetical protein ON010_g16827 [Phytophthora cinnamomi]
MNGLTLHYTGKGEGRSSSLRDAWRGKLGRHLLRLLIDHALADVRVLDLVGDESTFATHGTGGDPEAEDERGDEQQEQTHQQQDGDPQRRREERRSQERDDPEREREEGHQHRGHSDGQEHSERSGGHDA